MRNLHAYSTFIGELRRSYRSIGAIAPSSRFLARAISSSLRGRNGSLRVLEVGAGTGALTSEIVRYIRPGDQLDVVELNAQFIATLRRRFERERHFQRVADRTRLLHMPLQQLVADRPYDCIISGLPLNSFPTELLREVLESLRRLIAPAGVLSYFEYLFLRHVSRLFVSGRERRRLARISRVLEDFLEQHEFRRDTVWVNLPPAVVHHLRLGEKRQWRRESEPGGPAGPHSRSTLTASASIPSIPAGSSPSLIHVYPGA
jgi:phospholipid N-methyltransferase